MKHALPLVESLNEGLTDLIDWITQGEQLVEDGRMGRSADIQKYAEDLQVRNHVTLFHSLIYSEIKDRNRILSLYVVLDLKIFTN